MPGFEDLPAFATERRTPTLSDEYGNAAISGVTGLAGTPIDARIFDMLTRGAPNGSLSRIPPGGTSSQIEDINPLFDFGPPVQVSGGSFTATSEVDTSQPSGYCVRLKLDAGAAGDDGYIEYWTQVASSRTQSFAHSARLAAGNPSVSNSFLIYQTTQYYKQDGVTTTGTANTNTAAFSAITTPYDLPIVASSAPNAGTAAPADAWWLQVKIGIRRNGVAATSSGTVDLYEARVIAGTTHIVIPDRSTPSNINAYIFADASVLNYWAPGASGTHRFVGSVTGLTVTSGIQFPATQAPSADTNNLDDYEEGTFTPDLTYVTAGTSAYTASAQQGRYVKIGNTVFYAIRLSGTMVNGTAAGNLKLTGLPFTVLNDVASGFSLCLMTGYTKANFTELMFAPQQNTTTAFVNASGSGQTIANLAVADIPGGGAVVEIRAGGAFTATN